MLRPKLGVQESGCRNLSRGKSHCLDSILMVPMINSKILALGCSSLECSAPAEMYVPSGGRHARRTAHACPVPAAVDVPLDVRCSAFHVHLIIICFLPLSFLQIRNVHAQPLSHLVLFFLFYPGLEMSTIMGHSESGLDTAE